MNSFLRRKSKRTSVRLDHHDYVIQAEPYGRRQIGEKNRNRFFVENFFVAGFDIFSVGVLPFFRAPLLLRQLFDGGRFLRRSSGHFTWTALHVCTYIRVEHNHSSQSKLSAGMSLGRTGPSS
jgi:hypothetical protein